MDQNIAVADLCLKYDHLKQRLNIYINKLQILNETFNNDPVSLSFELLPTSRIVHSQQMKRPQNDIYFTFFEALEFKKIDPAEVGSMGLIVRVFSHVGRYKKLRIGDEYKPLDNLHLTSVMTRVIMPLTKEEVDYNKEHNDQRDRLEKRKTEEIMNSSTRSNVPMIALSFKYYRKFSRLDVYIQRLTNVDRFATRGYILLGFVIHSKLVSTNRSDDIIFQRDNLMHVSIPLDTKDLDLRDCAALIQICPLTRKDIQTQSVEFRKDFGVLYAMFGSETGVPLPAQILWNELINGEIDYRNRWHILKVGGIDV